MLPHEYSVIGHSRTTIGRFLGMIAAAIAAGSAVATGAATALARWAGMSDWASHVTLVPLSAAAVYPIAHWLFNKFAWKYVGKLLQLPNLDGVWECSGSTIDDNGQMRFQWQAEVTISQSWEKIHVTLRTGSSTSHSVAAALIPEADGSWMLMYSYRNEPRTGEPELHSHIGYCEMHFPVGLQTGDGDYFNARGRGTAGRMHLIRRK